MRFLLATAALAALIALGAAAAQAQTVIKVATQPDYPPFCFVDERGEPTGYDLEILKLVFEGLPEYELEFVPSAWDAVLIGFDSNKTQIIADNMGWTEERAARYNLTDPYFFITDYLVVKKGRTDIKSLEDLAGKRLALVVGTTPALVIEKWNEERGDPIDIVWTKATNYTDPLQDVAAGRVDAYVEVSENLKRVVEETGLAVEAVGEPVSRLPTVYVLHKDPLGVELTAKINAGLARLKAEGKYEELALKWIGSADGVPK
jgi:ABC-type amino acid transport substrate-binding protein